MKVSHVGICSQPYEYQDEKTGKTEETEILAKVWFSLNDDVFEQITDELNYLEL